MIINIQIDTENSKTLTDAVEFIKKLIDKPRKSETTPEFASVADDRTETAQADNSAKDSSVEIPNPQFVCVTDTLETPANMIKFCKTKLCSMAKNGSKDKAKEFMIRHKLKSTADIGTLSESRLTEFYHELARI